MSTKAELDAMIVAQGNKVRQLKADKAASSELESELASLKELKQRLEEMTGIPADAKGKKKATKFTLKTPKVRRSLATPVANC